ncbi:hypothetical protein CsSME_00000818 [Camellia sinensis var. sinensis]
MITKGYKQTSKTCRRLSFSISIPSLHSTSLSNLFVGGSSGGLSHSDIGIRSVDQSDPFYHHELNTHQTPHYADRPPPSQPVGTGLTARSVRAVHTP